VREILEADYLIDHERYHEARKIAGHCTARLPDNPWGWLRMGRICFEEGDFVNAGLHYRQVADIVPNYYGGWLKAAQCMLAAGDRTEAREFAVRDHTLNSYDPRIGELRKVLHAEISAQVFCSTRHSRQFILTLHTATVHSHSMHNTVSAVS
jgi:tetratricopeptide (TPR) repeat protein